MADKISYTGHVQEFIPAESDWSVYKRRLQNYFSANEIVNDDRKRAILLSLLNEDAYKLIYNMCLPAEPEDKSYSDIVKLMDNHFKPVISVFACREKFFEARKMTQESPKEFAARLRSLVAVCQFDGHEEIEKALVNRFIIGYEAGSVKDRLFEEKKSVTFEKVVEIASSKTAVQSFCFSDRNVIKKEPEIHYTKSQSKGHAQTHQASHPSTSRGIGNGRFSRGFQSGPPPVNVKCSVCGRRNHIADKCSFRECFCHECNKKGHLASMCPTRRKVNKVNTHNFNRRNNSHNFLESDYSLYTLDCKLSPILINLMCENVSYTFNLDTGASYSVISEKFYIENFKNKICLPTDKIFHLYNGDRIVPLGYITCQVTYQNKSSNLCLYVIKNGGPPLLGRDFFNLFDLSISHLNYLELPKDLQLVFNKYTYLFSPGLGTFTKGNISIKLKSDNVTPKFFRARPLPFAIKEKVEKELDRLNKLGVIEPIDYSPWGTPIVPVLKKDGSVRICGDFKVTVNPFIEIDPFPLPRIDDLFVKLQGGVHFTKLDLSNAYQQICLDEKSKELVTISTHKGLFRYNRAPFGIASIPGKFQRIVETLLQGLDGVVCFLDDILVTGKDRVEHIARLESVLSRLQDAGFKLSIEKCSFFQPKISYLGYDIDKEGLHTSESKILAINNAPAPTNVTALKSFIGLVNYYGKFVPNLADTLHPLYNLLKAKSKWEWTPSCDRAFKQIKQLLTSADILVHYNPDLPLCLTTDASDFGISAVISHIMSDGSERPIAYASRTLSDAERKYCQLEKEALSIIYGLCKFHTFLYARKFTLFTDNKPLSYIFHPHKNIPQFSANRLRRWAVILSNYQYEIKFVRSEQNHADSLSRLPLPFEENSWEDVDINFMNYFSENEDFPINFQIVREATLRDTILSKVIKYIKYRWPKIIDINYTPFFRIKNELSVESECLLWNNRIIIPETLRQSILQQLHATHMGTVKMKSLARSYFWWPGLDKDIENISKSCENCLLNKKAPNKAVLVNWPWPSEPWYRIHLDFMGPLFNKQFLIVLDAHSKWIEVYPMNSITSSLTIEILRSCFARFGLPKQVVTDNGTSFCSNEFENFLSQNNILHITSPPFHPSSNGAAENAVKTIKYALKNALGKRSQISLNKTLNNFLFDYRNTPHCTTKCSPANLMFGRNLRTRFNLLLPECNVDVKSRVLIEQTKQKIYHRGKREVEFVNGETVTVKNYKNVNKPTWIKAIVFKRIGRNTYIVKVPELNNVQWKRHLNQIKKFHFTESRLPDVNDTQVNSDINTDASILATSKNIELDESVTNSNLVSIRPRRMVKPPERLEYNKM